MTYLLSRNLIHRLKITNLTIDVNMTLAFQPITNQMFVKHLSTRFSVEAVKASA